jgi:hypothetical protein
MARVCTVASHLQVEEIDRRIQNAKAGWHARRWMIIRQALVEPQRAVVLASRFGVRPQTSADGLPAARASRGGDTGPRTAAASLLEPGAGAEIAGEFLPREWSWAREHGAWGQGGAGAGGGACRGQEYGILADEAPPMAQGGTAASPPPGHGGEAREV